MKTIENYDHRQLITTLPFDVVVDIFSGRLGCTSAGDARQILPQFASRLTVDVEHSHRLVAKTLPRPVSAWQTTYGSYP